MEVQNLLVDVTATYDAAFPVQMADNLVIAKERLRALPAHLWAMVFEAIHQGAATRWLLRSYSLVQRLKSWWCNRLFRQDWMMKIIWMICS